MRIQTSLEFVLILSAVSALILSTIIYYGKDLTLYTGGEKAYSNISMFQNPPTLKPNGSGLIAYVNQTSIVGKANPISMLLYGCQMGYANISVGSNASSILYKAYQNIIFNDTYPMTDYFMPANVGLVNLEIRYSIFCSKESSNGTYTLSSFSQVAANSTSATSPYPTKVQLSAYISQRNESLSYNNFSSNPLYTLSESSHCTFTTFSGTPLPASRQCQNGDSWDYQVFSGSCYESGQSQTETYCIYPTQTGTDIKSPSGQNYNYKYNFSLGIYNGTSAYLSSLNSSSASSPVFYNGADIGTANVMSVYSQPYSPNFEILSNNTSSKFANSTYLNSYEQAQTSAFSTFSFYNNTVGDQSAIQQQLAEFNNAAQQLLASRPQSIQGCNILASSLYCSSPYPFQYSINVNLGKSPVHNQTIYAEGSKVKINST